MKPVTCTRTHFKTIPNYVSVIPARFADSAFVAGATSAKEAAPARRAEARPRQAGQSLQQEAVTARGARCSQQVGPWPAVPRLASSWDCSSVKLFAFFYLYPVLKTISPNIICPKNSFIVKSLLYVVRRIRTHLMFSVVNKPKILSFWCSF